MSARVMSAWCVGALLAVGCYREQTSTLPAKEPVLSAELRIFGTSLSRTKDVDVKLVRSASLADAANMRIFGQFRPGMTHDDARRVAGAPTRTRRDGAGAEWYEYDIDGGHVAIGCERSGSDVERKTGMCIWRLYAYPRADYNAVLHPEIAKLVTIAHGKKPKAKALSLTIRPASDDAFVSYLEREQGRSVLWQDTKHGRVRDPYTSASSSP